MTHDEIVNLIQNNIFQIIGWTIATITPVITGLVVALGLVWSKSNKKDEEIKELTKEYYETLKSLTPFFEKTAEVQTKIYQTSQDLKTDLENLLRDTEAEKDDIAELKNKLDTLITLWGSNGKR